MNDFDESCIMCNGYYVNIGDWISCDICNIWYYRMCVNIQDEEEWCDVSEGFFFLIILLVEWICIVRYYGMGFYRL